MFNRIQKTFQQTTVKAAYVMAGDGSHETTLKRALALITGGANMLEIGIPFSDPVADGPVIQAAAKRALAEQTTVHDVFLLVQELRKHTDVPIIIMSYFNPIYQYSIQRFLADAQTAGVDGLLIVDLPLEELSPLKPLFKAHAIDPILIIAPHTPQDRIKKIAACGSGFLYYACRYGTTGARNALPDRFAEKIAEIKNCTDLPILVGFGISTPAMVEEVLRHAEGLVVASYFVQAIANGASLEELSHCAKKLFGV